MASPNPDRRLMAASRLVENLAELMPIVRQLARIEIGYADGHGSQTLGAGIPTAHRTTRASGRCAANVPSDTDGELVDCGRPRPCAEHDTPVALTSVESAAEQRIQIEQWLGDIEDRCVLIAISASEALASGRRIIGTRVAVAKPVRCTGGTQRDGYIEWGRPDCDEIQSRGELCDACSKREYRWRRDRGLRPRHDGVFSGAAIGGDE